MARTIGTKNKRFVKSLVNEAKRKGLEGIKETTEYVIGELPEEVFDTWEGAYSEIENLISDLVFENNRTRRKKTYRANPERKIKEKFSKTYSFKAIEKIPDQLWRQGHIGDLYKSIDVRGFKAVTIRYTDGTSTLIIHPIFWGKRPKGFVPNPKKGLYQIWHSPDGKRFTDVVKQGKDVGKLWDYLLINPEIRKYLVVNRQAKFRLINATTKQIIAELPKLKKTLRANPKRTGPVFLDAHRKKHPWVQYITKEGEVIYPPAPAVHLSRKEALRIKKAWEKMELPFMKYRLVPLKYGGWGVEGISSWRTNPVKDIRIQICEYLTKLKRPITEENIGFAYRAITGKLLTMRELADLDESIEKMLRR